MRRVALLVFALVSTSAWGFDELWQRAAAQAREGAWWAPAKISRKRVVADDKGRTRQQREEQWVFDSWEGGKPRFRGASNDEMSFAFAAGDLNPFLLKPGEEIFLESVSEGREGEQVVRSFTFRQKHPKWGWMRGQAVLEVPSGSPLRLSYGLLELPTGVKAFASEIVFRPCRVGFVVPVLVAVKVDLRVFRWGLHVDILEAYSGWFEARNGEGCTPVNASPRAASLRGGDGPPAL